MSDHQKIIAKNKWLEDVHTPSFGVPSLSVPTYDKSEKIWTSSYNGKLFQEIDMHSSLNVYSFFSITIYYQNTETCPRKNFQST